MPKIHPYKDHKLYKKLKKDAKKLGDNNFCTVLAAAAITGLTYKECFDAFEQAGRKKKQGANILVQKKAFKILGYKMVKYPIWNIKKRYKGAHKNLKYLTTYHPIRFAYAWRDAPDLYLQGSKHAAAYVGGKIVDWSNDRKSRVTSAYRVVKLKRPRSFSLNIPIETTGSGSLSLERDQFEDWFAERISKIRDRALEEQFVIGGLI